MLASCTTFDKDATRPLVELTSTSGPASLKHAALEVFGREGFTAVNPSGNPMIFVRPAGPADRLAYQQLAVGGDLVNRVFLKIAPIGSATHMSARVLIISRPGTQFESTNYPMIGARAFYKKLLKKTSDLAASNPMPEPAFSAMPPPPSAPAGAYAPRSAPDMGSGLPADRVPLQGF